MSKSILIVEDEKVLRESMAELLAEEGYDVVQAPDGKVAHQLLLAERGRLRVGDQRPVSGVGQRDRHRGRPAVEGP